ncbi:TetR/AcrR family transcriptional regulator [Kibdelosporangium persicum]|uniref:DNA-binding transcriptional regulator, AcrR family n=1 Tax=Kibdelosporangium persicum TaxID=2698649 RepID=A0ABX2FI16_9PSEU|nr:TetR/AcrR family transcriptional regulator [Kibdelosporangium persicum]NRN70754.1 DNA-binding transcriptional regulator, AcrR family [Kibdelosporangium persicum]
MIFRYSKLQSALAVVKANDCSPKMGDMPRITDRRRAANRAAIVDAARRCFARDGFHQTSMPDLVAEAGISAGAFYRYFSGKDELIREIARESFDGIGPAVVERMKQLEAPSVADVIAVLTNTFMAGTITVEGRDIDLREHGLVAVQAWAEVARNEHMREEAHRGTELIADGCAGALARGQRAGRVPANLDPDDGARLVLALLPGIVLHGAVFGHDVAVIARAATVLLDG